MENKIQEGIYFGKRDASFKECVYNILKRGNLKSEYLDLLTNETNMKLYSDAFTSDLVDDNHNYQVYEQLGDSVCNKFIVDYMYKRFPFLGCCEGVKVVARLKINYGAKKSFYQMGNSLGLWSFITAPNDFRQTQMKSLIEDVFEAFFGLTESLLDTYFRVGVGYGIVFTILKSIFDKIDISLSYEDLYDSHTRIKELFDMFSDKLGKLEHKYSNDNVNHSNTCILYRVYNGERIELSTAKSPLASDALQQCCKLALVHLNKQGYIKHTPKIYTLLQQCIQMNLKVIPQQSKVNLEDVDKLQTINHNVKNQIKYSCPSITLACKMRDVSNIEKILEKKPNLNIRDTYGMTAFDLLFIGEIDTDIVTKILVLFTVYKYPITLHSNVFTTYYSQYTSTFFLNLASKINII